jgi:HK97 family phage major capsid protein
MNNRIKKLAEKKQAAITKMDEILQAADNEDRDLTAEEQTSFDGYKSECDSTQALIEREEAYMKHAATQMPVVPDIATAEPGGTTPRPDEPKKVLLPARVKRYAGQLRCFQGPDAGEKAFSFGMWLYAIAGSPQARNWCKLHGINLEWIEPQAVHEGSVNTTGGYLVRPEWDTDIIRLVESYGVARRLCRTSPMATDVRNRPRRTGGLTAYFVGEGDAGTESTAAWDNVQLVAKDVMVLTRLSNQLQADAMVNVADQVAMEIAYALAKLEDDCLFKGDGTSTYGGITGLKTRLTDVWTSTTADSAGVCISTGATIAATVLQDYYDVLMRLPDFAIANARWLVNLFVAGDMLGLQAAAGGNTIRDLEAGRGGMKFMGYPIESCNSMPRTDTASQIFAIFGDVSKAADFGDRQQMTVALSEHASVGGQSVFERNQIAMRATERFDINVHDVGDGTSAGPIIGLRAAAS